MLNNSKIQSTSPSAASPGPRVLIVSHVLPYPPAAGNETRIYKLLLWLRREGFQVYLILRPLDDSELSNDILVGSSALVDGLWVFDSRTSMAARSAPQGSPLLIESADESVTKIEDGFCPLWFAGEVAALIESMRPDVVVAQYVFMSRILALPQCCDALKVIDSIDLFSRKQQTVDQYRVKNFPLALSEAQESFLLRRADLVLAIQHDEEQALRELVPDVDVIITGVDLEARRTLVEDQVPGRVLIVASGNEFNVRGTQDFLDYTWPLVREKVPHARLRVMGKVCQQVRSDDPSVDLVGFVESLDDEYRKAEVVVNPCRVGTGLKIKTVEALSWGKAHVAWPSAADGLRELGEVPVCIERDIVAFADAIAALILDGARRRTVEAAARRFIEGHFSPEHVYGALAGRIAAHCQKEEA